MEESQRLYRSVVSAIREEMARLSAADSWGAGLTAPKSDCSGNTWFWRESPAGMSTCRKRGWEIFRLGSKAMEDGTPVSTKSKELPSPAEAAKMERTRTSLREKGVPHQLVQACPG